MCHNRSFIIIKFIYNTCELDISSVYHAYSNSCNGLLLRSTLPSCPVSISIIYCSWFRKLTNLQPLVWLGWKLGLKGQDHGRSSSFDSGKAKAYGTLCTPWNFLIIAPHDVICGHILTYRTQKEHQDQRIKKLTNRLLRHLWVRFQTRDSNMYCDACDSSEYWSGECLTCQTAWYTYEDFICTGASRAHL